MVGVGDALAHQVRSDQTRTMNLAPIKRPGRRLTALLRIDGSISLGFGIATALFQSAIFNTAVDLKSAGVTGRGDSLMESALLTLSGYYVLVLRPGRSAPFIAEDLACLRAREGPTDRPSEAGCLGIPG